MALLRRFYYWFAPLGVPIAWRQLISERKRLIAALMGITFGLMLMLFQLGLYEGIMAMVVLPIDNLRGELVLISPNFEYFGSSMEFSRRRVYEARALPEVNFVAPLYLGFLSWTNPETTSTKITFAMGFNPSENPFTNPDIVLNLPAIRDPESVLFDRQSADSYGPIPALFAAHGPVETQSERKRVLVKGLFTMGHTLAASANLVMSDEAYFRLRPDKPRNMANVGLIGLRAGTDPEAAAARLRAILPNDVLVLSRPEFMRREQEYWRNRTPIGFVSAAGVLVGLFVGAIVVYQILYTDVNDHLREYATLKAIGLSDRFFIFLVLQEAAMLLLLSFVPAAAFSAGLNYVARTAAHIPTTMTATHIVLVFFAAGLMCLAAALLATRRLRSADPADVF